MEQILGFITQHGLPAFVIGCISIANAGILKLCKVFDKITSKDLRHVIFFVLDVALAFGCAAVYFYAFKLDWKGYPIFSALQISATTSLYAIYEGVRGKKLIQIIINAIVKCFKNNDAFKKLAKKLGLPEEVVTEMAADITNVNENSTKKQIAQDRKRVVLSIKKAYGDIEEEDRQIEEQKAKAEVQIKKDQSAEQEKAQLESIKIKIRAAKQATKDAETENK